MIEAFVANTTNGQRVVIALEELGLDHQLRYVDLWSGAHKKPDFLALNAAGQIPVIIDNDDSSGRLVLTQTPAILVYLAAKTGSLPLLASAAGAKHLEWLMFQTTDVSGPMAQRAYLARHDATRHAAAMAKLKERALSFYRLLDHRLGESRFLAGDSYSIADIMAYPAARGFEHDEFPALRHVSRWLTEVGSREPVVRGLSRLAQLHAARAEPRPATDPTNSKQDDNIRGGLNEQH